MDYPERKALSEARFERASESLSAACQLIESKQYRSAANRLYYAVFTKNSHEKSVAITAALESIFLIKKITPSYACPADGVI